VLHSAFARRGFPALRRGLVDCAPSGLKLEQFPKPFLPGPNLDPWEFLRVFPRYKTHSACFLPVIGTKALKAAELFASQVS